MWSCIWRPESQAEYTVQFLPQKVHSPAANMNTLTALRLEKRPGLEVFITMRAQFQSLLRARPDNEQEECCMRAAPGISHECRRLFLQTQPSRAPRQENSRQDPTACKRCRHACPCVWFHRSCLCVRFLAWRWNKRPSEHPL